MSKFSPLSLDILGTYLSYSHVLLKSIFNDRQFRLPSLSVRTLEVIEKQLGTYLKFLKIVNNTNSFRYGHN